LMSTIEELGRDPRYSLSALNHLSATIRPEQVAARNKLAAELPFKKIQRLARRLAHAAQQRESAHAQRPQRRPSRPQHAWVWVLEARAIRRAAGVRYAIETAGMLYVPDRLHDIRIAVKKLRYALELDAEARSGRRSRHITILRQTQDLLGRLHDLEVLIGRARHEQASLSPPTLELWREFDSLVSALEDDCRALHARFLSDRAKLIGMAHRIGDTRPPAFSDHRRAAAS
jgi:CHAD domain-containing protein